MRKRTWSFVLATLCALTLVVGLVGCAGSGSGAGGDQGEPLATETTDGWDTVSLADVNTTVETNVTFPADYVQMTVTVEKGSVDVTIARPDGTEEGDEDGVVLFEAIKLTGTETFSFGVPDGGDCVLTVTGADATGTIAFEEGTPGPV